MIAYLSIFCRNSLIIKADEDVETSENDMGILCELVSLAGLLLMSPYAIS